MTGRVYPSATCPIRLDDADPSKDIWPTFAKVVTNSETTIPELLAVLRLWDPVVQDNIGAILYELLDKRDFQVDDRDSITDMTLLHFACKAGAPEFTGAWTMPKKARPSNAAAAVVADLVSRGADVDSVCQWTKMAPLHYAAFFNSSDVINTLMTMAKPSINATCANRTFEGATPLHLASLAGAAEAVEALLKHGADASIVDDRDRTALECALEVSQACGGNDDNWAKILDALEAATPEDLLPPPLSPGAQSPGGAGGDDLGNIERSASPRKAAVAQDDLQQGARVLVNGHLVGTVRYTGVVMFDKKEDWMGVQLDTDEGKNNGTVKGVEYFRCKPNHGLFVRAKACQRIRQPASRNLTKHAQPGSAGRPGSGARPSTAATSGTSPGPGPAAQRAGQTPAAATTRSRVETPLSASKQGFGVGCKVLVDGKMCVVKYCGTIEVDEGLFIGVEVPDASGRNDGAINGVRYFDAPPDCGKFVRPARCTWRGAQVTIGMAVRAAGV